MTASRTAAAIGCVAALAGAAHGAPDGTRVGAFGQLVATRYTAKDGLPPGALEDVDLRDGRVVVSNAAGAWELEGQRWRPAAVLAVPEPPEVAVAAGLAPGERIRSRARTTTGEVWLTTTAGRALRVRDGRAQPLDLPKLYKAAQPLPNLDSVLRYVAADGAGSVYIGSDLGVFVTDGRDWWHPLTRADGMPYEDVLCLAVAPNGDLWGGTTEGAWRLRAGRWSYFWGQRWLPGNRVSGIAVDARGAVWLATDGGVAKIEERPTTLAQKAAHYEEITQARHSRRGWVTSCDLTVRGEPDAGIVPVASDNDGLWTAIYIGAEAFRFAATKDPKARDNARRSLEALLDLTRLSGYPGFPARAILRKGEVAHGYDPEETVRVPGETDKIWYTPPGHPDLLCKGDTSSDELDGHYFGWYVYYTLVADDREKEEIRQVCRAVTNNLLDHDYNLVGPTGRKTRWGVFGPRYINDDPRWWDQRGLNSLEMLDYLKVAAHICGDKRFTDTYEDLIANHHYLLNTLNVRPNREWWQINHSDDELSHLDYYNILQLERDPHRRAILQISLREGWSGQNGIRDERSPFYDYVYAIGTGAPCRAQEAVETLEEWPWDLVDWTVKNSQRHDVTLRTARGIRKPELDRVLPIGERALMRWNGNPWEPDGGSDGMSEEDGSAWLLAYWMGRYYGYVVE